MLNGWALTGAVAGLGPAGLLPWISVMLDMRRLRTIRRTGPGSGRARTWGSFLEPLQTRAGVDVVCYSEFFAHIYASRTRACPRD